MSRIKVALESLRQQKSLGRRRGPRKQRRRREAERIVRVSALAFLRWMRVQGLSLAEAAERLGLDPSTLRVWNKRWKENHLCPRERGRPQEQIRREELWSFLAIFGLIGPQASLATLQSFFPEMARSALLDLQERCRAIYRRRVAWLVHTLRWTRPGTVWAMDFAVPPRPIEGIYQRLLVVRDLASGHVLLAMPALEENAETVLRALESLFRWFGPPLVLKSDNGSPFVAEEVKTLLHAHGVAPLYSPPGTPSYNGSAEAGIGSIRVRTFWQAALHDRPGEWTCDDVEAAVQEANETGRPRGIADVPPREAWTWRLPITEAQRTWRCPCHR